MNDRERVINANMLADSRVSYHLDPKKEIRFAPLDPSILAEATHDASGLTKTQVVQTTGNTPVSVAELPEPSIPNPTNTPEKNLPTKTPKVDATKVSPSDTPIPATETNIPPTNTPLPATATPSATLKPTETATNHLPAPTQTPTEKPTKKPKKPTTTPVPPTLTSSPTQTTTETFTTTPQPTFTWTVAATFTHTPSPTNTSVSPPTDTPIPSPTDTLVPSPTDTPIIPPTDTPIIPPTDTPVPLPTNTPTPTYRNIRPLLTCVRYNGDDTYTAFFGYRNPNDYSVNIPYGNRNRVIPGIIVPGQPTDFSPGQHDSVFSVDFQIGAMYILDGRIRLAGPGDNCP